MLTVVDQLCADCSSFLSVHIPEMNYPINPSLRKDTGGLQWGSSPEYPRMTENKGENVAQTGG